jgi:glycosyltransferase involved in cell wall biosynthesis
MSGELTYHLHGWVDNRDLIEFYRNNPVDIFVNFSTNEGVPVSIMEANSFGIPAVATDVDGTGEVCISGHSGLLIEVDEPEDPSALAKKVMEAMCPGGEIAKSAPREVWQEYYNSDRNYGLVTRLLSQLPENDMLAES